MKLEICVALCALTFVAHDALACGFVSYGDAPKPRKVIKKPPPLAPSDRVAQADREVDQGRYDAALADVRIVYPNLFGRRWISSDGDRLEIRAARAMALAFVRTGAEGEKLEWSVHVLRDISKNTRANDPAAQADLAEALAKQPDTRREAKDILEPLVKKDLVGSAHAYAALASIRESEGEPASDLRVRCADMSSTPAMCKAPAIAQVAVPAKPRS